MKKLKFMLAAATAIGLASATQADQYNTTGFEKLTVGTNVTTGVKDNDTVSYFYYAGLVAEDNESVIAEAGDMTGIARPRGAAAVDAGRDKILQVSTGTDPLMRTYEPIAGGVPQDSAITADIYVDTLVQFTVTPYTDTVTPGSSDKLMVYLKESVVTNEFGEITSASTNLVVVGGYYDAEAEGDKFVKEEYVAATTVVPGQWHRLTVKVIKNLAGGAFAETQKYPAFKVYVDNELCTFDKATAASGATTLLPFMQGDEFAAIQAKQVVLSLLANGTTAATIQGVGFAGEGKVDDIVFGTVDPFATVYDFTFAFGTGVSAVTYTVGGTEYDQARTFPEVEAGTAVQITSVTYADDYMAGSTTAVNLSDPVEGVYTVTNAGASLTITPAEAYASVNGQKYGTFAGAFAAAAGSSSADPADHTVQLVRNLSDSTPMGTTVASGQSAVLDLNGKTITTLQGSSYWMTIAGTLVVTDSTEQASGKIESRPTNQTIFKVDGTFTMAAGTLDMTTVNPANTASGFNVKAGGTAYMNGGTVLGRIASGVTNATVVVNGGTVDIVQSKNRGDVTINGGTVGAIEKSGTSENGNIVIPALVNNELNPTQFGTNMVGEVSYDAFLNPADGYEVVQPDGSSWFGVNLAIYTIAYLNSDGSTFDSWASEYTAPTSYTINDAVTLPTTNDVTLSVMGVTFDGWTNETGKVTGWAAGQTGAVTVYAKLDPIVAPPSGEELEPGEKKEYSTEPTPAELAEITIVPSDAVSNALETAGVSLATYTAMFETVKTYDETAGKWYAEVVPTAATTNALQIQANADAAEVIDDLSESTVTLTTTPGFYYSFEYGTTLGGMAEVGTRTLATGSTLELTRPTTGGATAGFYKVLINIAPAAVATP